MKNLHKANVDYLIHRPFTVFEIKNFLSEEKYLELLETFPNTKNFGNSKEGNVIDPGSAYYEDHLNKNKGWNNFISLLNNQKFIDNAYKFALIPSIRARGIKAIKKWTLREKGYLLKKFFRRVTVEAHFTIQRRGEFLNLHTDAKSKLLSMIYYFADDNSNLKNAGTEFWVNKKNYLPWKNWENKHITSKDRINKFKLENEVFFKSNFEKNKLVGFIKTNNSWHSVLDHNITAGEVRRAFVINIREG